MDIFSLASNLQQIAIGGVNYVNSKLRKKNLSSECNYATYIVIGEKEERPYDVNMFFFPFPLCTKMKLKEFKDYFPFKDNVIFRFKIPLTDLVDIINEGILNDVPLLSKKEKSENPRTYIITDENEIKSIIRQDNTNHVWLDITNDEAYIPLYNGNIVVKVLFINNENYKKFNDIYFKNANYYEYASETYVVNKKNPCSYIPIKEERNKKDSTDNCDMNQSEYCDEDIKPTSSKNNTMNYKYSKESSNSGGSNSRNDRGSIFSNAVSALVGNAVSGARGNHKSDHDDVQNAMANCENKTYIENSASLGEYEKRHLLKMQNEDQSVGKKGDDSFFSNNYSESHFINQKMCSDVLNSKGGQSNLYKDTLNENVKKDTNSRKYTEQNELSGMGGMSGLSGRHESVLEKYGCKNSTDLLSTYNIERQDSVKTKVSNRLQELKEHRYQEEVKFKEKAVASEKIKKQIFKWSKNSDDTYKDLKVMLSTLNDVLWENSEWKHVSMSELISNTAMVKKTYKNAILLCHPDKHRDKSVERVLRAEMIFQALNNAYKEKKNL
ncbi:conserved Plasmodium protein, unknown function [Plasmodium ovale]|uniref:DnaJ protein n=2 Tax=Plasmodium ovale TaxID=36330 RepID=A0A1A8W4D2_PLAOA|nr:hypothetical protein, conserved [Plasmodium ovale curtisi]SBS97713.1 hypothetical protein, conserved [Plasmodium ovale curtisi]SCP06298.1 conserved Plasmodium protein, unknown function [Plasmodium ovale]